MRKDLMFLAIKIAIFIAIILFTFSFIFGLDQVEGAGMEPSASAGDIVLYYRLGHGYSSGDMVISEYREEPTCLRIIAKSGDKLDISSKGVLVNDYPILETYTYGQRTLVYKEGPSYPLNLDEDEYFLMGDNRSQAVDSRFYGPIQGEDIKGKVILVIRKNNL